ncbi:MAG: hypothetical protein AB7G18_06480 [Pyrinomonadaceae bacterium]
MTTFRKQEDCPTSQELLCYQMGDMGSSESRSIGKHLLVCEFCTSEVAFYEHYPVSKENEESPSETEMPESLYELAEALLNQKRGSQSIAEIMKDVESPTRGRR